MVDVQIRLAEGEAPRAPPTAHINHSIIADPKNPALYTNRAMARLKLGNWESVVADCNESLKLKPDSMKAFYHLSQAQLALGDYDAALDNALKAHALCIKMGDKSLPSVTAQVLRCKKERWEALERRRHRENEELENEVVALLERERDATLAAVEGDDDAARQTRDDVRREHDAKIAAVRDVFEKARPASEKRREVPEWAIDDITFNIMVDPVVVSKRNFPLSCCP